MYTDRERWEKRRYIIEREGGRRTGDVEREKERTGDMKRDLERKREIHREKEKRQSVD